MVKRYMITNTGDIEEHPDGSVVMAHDVDDLLGKLGEAQDARETIELELLEKIDGLQSRLDQVAEWLACSPQAEHISKRRCEELLLLVGGRIKPAVVERHDPLAEKERQRDKLRDDMSGITDVMLGVETSIPIECGDRHVDGATRLHKCTLHKGHDGYHGAGLFAWPPR